MGNPADRRAAPRLGVKARSSVKIDGRVHDVELLDISPVGARLAAKIEETPPLGASAKLYLRSGKVLDAVVARLTDTGFAVTFKDGAPPVLPFKTFYWKLESHGFSGAYAPEARTPHQRHLADDSLVESCTVLDWSEAGARIDTPIRLWLGDAIHLCGRHHQVRSKHGRIYELTASSPTVR